MASRARQASGSTTTRSRGASTRVTTDHEESRLWAEERGARPARVPGTDIIRLDFPGYSGDETLEHISWDEFFEIFDRNNLALLYQEETARGQRSNFNKLIDRGSVEGTAKRSRASRTEARGRRASARTGNRRSQAERRSRRAARGGSQRARGRSSSRRAASSSSRRRRATRRTTKKASRSTRATTGRRRAA